VTFGDLMRVRFGYARSDIGLGLETADTALPSAIHKSR
jgi:hypothetical protein